MKSIEVEVKYKREQKDNIQGKLLTVLSNGTHPIYVIINSDTGIIHNVIYDPYYIEMRRLKNANA